MAEVIEVPLAISALERTAQSSLSWFTTRLRGITLLIIGPPNSGKTAFFDYLVSGYLFSESGHITTIKVKTSPTFSIPIGNNNTLNLRVRRSFDTPGQIGFLAQSDLIKNKRPHAVLLVLDSTTSASSLKNRTSEFCTNLSRVLNESPALKKRLRSLIICLNKRDKVRNAQHFSARFHAVRSELEKGLATTIGLQSVQSITVMPCVSVRTPVYASTLIDDVIAKLATQVQ